MSEPLMIPELWKPYYKRLKRQANPSDKTLRMLGAIEQIARAEAENHHRFEQLSDMATRDELSQREIEALRAQVERLSEALENLIDPFTHNPLCECKNCKAKAVLIAARKEAGNGSSCV